MRNEESRYCIWCGTAREPQNSSAGGQCCTHCRRVSEPAPPETTTQRCGKCQALYPSPAHYCPACGTISTSCPPSHLQSEHGLLPSPRQPIWPLKSWWRQDGEHLEAPPCPVCGQKLRAGGAAEHRHIGQACPPWNAGWDGSCAACGHQVQLVVEQKTHFETKRVVTAKPAESFHQTFFDEGIVFAGVTLRVEETTFGGEIPRTSEVFLSMGELMTLVRSLEAGCRPLLSQADWSCDWT